MQYVLEDPFGDVKAAAPLIWRVSQAEPTASLPEIRERQLKLLPYLLELKAAAEDVLKHAGSQVGGDLFLRSLRRTVNVEVLYRLPDHPGIVQHMGPLPIDTHPVTLPASVKPNLPIFDYLFPTQVVMDLEGKPNKKAILHSEASHLGLIRQPGISDGLLSPERIVIYPRVLDFAVHWIGKIDGTMAAVRYVEAENEPNIRAGSSARSRRSSSGPKAKTSTLQ